MVLRAWLAQNRGSLKVFRASARLTGFARQLSQVLAEIQRAQLTPEALRRLAGSVRGTEGLAAKLEDLATLLEHYHEWLRIHELQDESVLLVKAAELLREQRECPFHIEKLWVDGFAEFADLELDLLEAILPRCDSATVTFCLEAVPQPKTPWLSHWSLNTRSFEACSKRFRAIPGVEVVTQTLDREAASARLAMSPVLKHLESFWQAPRPYLSEASAKADEALRLLACENREAEVIAATREIRAFARSGGRYREASVLVRTLDPYYQLIQRIFPQYDIPFFLDRRESVSHHALAELTRSAVRLVAFGWKQQDWFAALKTGLVCAENNEVDLLDNEALARGWNGQAWHQPIHLRDEPKDDQDRVRLERLEIQLESIRSRLVPPFEKFTLALAVSGNHPTGAELAVALRTLWNDLAVDRQLDGEAGGALEVGRRTGISVHETVWRQMNEWLDNAALAFPREPLPLRDWVSILETGLANLTIGIIPPSMDQVLVGAVDRSRTPEVKLALVLGLNEGVFPALPQVGSLLTETDRHELENRDVVLGAGRRRHIGRERYLGYIACTRARQRLVLTWAAQDSAGAPLLASPLLSTVRQLFPGIQPGNAPLHPSWKEAEHASELVDSLLKIPWPNHDLELLSSRGGSEIVSLPPLGGLLDGLKHLVRPQKRGQLAPELATRLYGPVLRTSISRMEQFAACPFQFFVRSGLRAEERRLFELDPKEQGTFQHDVLALFHQQLRSEGKLWRDITPTQARERIAQISSALMAIFRGGLLQSSPASRFTAGAMTESLQDFVETLVEWMHSQYLFDPVEVELPFGEDEASPAWTMDLGDGNRIELYGRIDRVDLHRAKGSDRAKCIVIDYKSGHKQLDSLLVTHGLQLQLLAYLNVVRNWPRPLEIFGVNFIEPAGVFYVNLRGQYKSGSNRLDVLSDPGQTRKMAYRHSGRFDKGALPQLDNREDVQEGDQFNYRLTRSRQVNQRCKEPVDAAELQDLLQQVADNLRRMGKEIYAGRVEVAPYRFGALTACDRCAYKAICRFDPWTDSFRVLKREPAGAAPQPKAMPA